MKKSLFWATVLSAALLAASCGSAAQSTAGETAAEAGAQVQAAESAQVKPFVGICMEVLADNPYQIAMGDAIKAKCEALGAEYVFDAPQSFQDATQQVNIVEGFIAKGCNIIIIATSHSDAMTPVFKQAKEKGIVVALVDDYLDGEEKEELFTNCIMPFNEEDAYKATKYMIEKIGGKGKVLNIEGEPGFFVAKLRSDGFARACAEHPEIEVVASQPGGWTEEGGLRVAENILTAHPDVAGIFCANDGMAYGAIAALKARGSQAVVVGIDADQRALGLIKSGEYAATVGVDFERMADWSVRSALAQLIYFQGAMPDGDGQAFQPFVKLVNCGSVLIDGENVDEFIKE